MTSMPRQRGVTETQPQRALSNPNPNGCKTSQRTLMQPKMGLQWNSGSLSRHGSSYLQCNKNNPKITKRNNQERGISLTIMGQRSIYNSTHKPQRNPRKC